MADAGLREGAVQNTKLKRCTDSTNERHILTDEQIVELHGRLIRRIAVWGWVDDKEDLAQDALIVLLKRLRDRGLDDPDRAFGYLVGIARRLAIGAVRKSVRRKTEPDSVGVENACADTASPEQLLADREMAVLAHDLVARLGTERDRLLAGKHYLCEQDSKTVQQDMELSSAQLHRLLYRVRSRLRVIAEPVEGDCLALLS